MELASGVYDIAQETLASLHGEGQELVEHTLRIRAVRSGPKLGEAEIQRSNGTTNQSSRCRHQDRPGCTI
jgi:hypothetical protein